MRTESNRTFIALIAALIPGLGQVYNREFKKAMLFGLVLIVAYVFIGESGILLQYTGLLIATLGMLALYLYPIADALWHARERTDNKSGRFNFQFSGAMLVVISIFYLFGSPSARSEILGVRALYYPTGASMQQTIQDGDFVLLHTKAFEGRLPKRGEIVVFSHPDYPYLVTKRVIAIGGETVSGDGTTVYVHGRRLDEPYAWHSQNGKLEFGPLVVPAGKFFVMGDNRDHSRDSSFGFLDARAIVGKPLYVYWSQDFKRLGRRLQ